MDRYIPPIRSDELYHWGIERGKEAKNHKYYQRIQTGTKNGQNIYRYFYTKSEWDTYNKPKTQQAPTSKSNLTVTFDDGETRQIDEKPKEERNKPSILSQVLFGQLGSRLIQQGMDAIKHIIDEDNQRKAEEERAAEEERQRQEEEKRKQEEAYRQLMAEQEERAAQRREEEAQARADAQQRTNDKIESNKALADSLGAIENPDGDAKYVYLAKIPMGDGTFRYFYDKESLENYYRMTGKSDLVDAYGIAEQPQDPGEIAADVVNPHYDEGVEYQTNCYSCQASYEMERRGYNVESIPDEGLIDNSLQGIENDYIGVKDHRIRENISADDAANRFIESCLAEGDGARGVLTYCWEGTVEAFLTGGSSSGHTNNWEVINGQVFIIDSQTHTYLTGDQIAAYFSYTDINNANSQVYDLVNDAPIAWFRTDNLEINTREMAEIVRRRK